MDGMINKSSFKLNQSCFNDYFVKVLPPFQVKVQQKELQTVTCNLFIQRVMSFLIS